MSLSRYTAEAQKLKAKNAITSADHRVALGEAMRGEQRHEDEQVLDPLVHPHFLIVRRTSDRFCSKKTIVLFHLLRRRGDDAVADDDRVPRLLPHRHVGERVAAIVEAMRTELGLKAHLPSVLPERLRASLLARTPSKKPK